MTRSLSCLVIMCLLSACPSVPLVADAGNVIDAGLATASRSSLRWKRFRTLQNDLAGALELEPNELCTEAGSKQCVTVGFPMLTDILEANGVVNVKQVCGFLQGHVATCNDAPIYELKTPKGVHVLPLGGNEPLLGETFEPIAEPGITTPLAFDRLVLSACGERAARDVSAAAPVVFNKLDIKAIELTVQSEGVDAQIVELYRRLLARDPTDDEVAAIRSMLEGAPSMSARQFAQLACYAIGTSTEVLFQ